MPKKITRRRGGLTVAQAAARLRMNERTIYRMLGKELDAVRVGSGRGRWRIRLSSIAAYEQRTSLQSA